MDPFDELVERVKSLVGLNGRAASQVAGEFDENAPPTAKQIVEKAIELGYEVTTQPGKDPNPPGIGAEISMDPATVLAEVYENCPRVLAVNFPAIGRAPAQLEAHEDLMAEIEQLPEEIRVLLVKIDMADERMTVWLRDEANDVDRPLGPIDLRPYKTGEQLHGALMVLLQRLPLVLRSDFN